MLRYLDAVFKESIGINKACTFCTVAAQGIMHGKSVFISFKTLYTGFFSNQISVFIIKNSCSGTVGYINQLTGNAVSKRKNFFVFRSQSVCIRLSFKYKLIITVFQF